MPKGHRVKSPLEINMANAKETKARYEKLTGEARQMEQDAEKAKAAEKA